MNTGYQSTEPGLDVLSIGVGDIKIKFDGENPVEVARAAQIIRDMLRRGYSLFVHGPDQKLVRVQQFDEKTFEYVIATGPDAAPEPVIESPAEPQPPKQRGRPRKERVPMASSKATVVGRSAGG